MIRVIGPEGANENVRVEQIHGSACSAPVCCETGGVHSLLEAGEAGDQASCGRRHRQVEPPSSSRRFRPVEVPWVRRAEAPLHSGGTYSEPIPLGASIFGWNLFRTEPNRTKKSPAPRFHAVRKWIRKELYQTYTLFVQAYREAAELLRMGNRNAVFPRGCFPPPLPFVG